MTLKNEEGTVHFDTTTRQFLILFSPEGQLKYSTAGLPCNLKPEFQLEYKVRFDADFFVLKQDSLVYPENTLSMYIRKIEFL
jgi:hypothetical protein